MQLPKGLVQVLRQSPGGFLGRQGFTPLLLDRLLYFPGEGAPRHAGFASSRDAARLRFSRRGGPRPAEPHPPGDREAHTEVSVEGPQTSAGWPARGAQPPPWGVLTNPGAHGWSAQGIKNKQYRLVPSRRQRIAKMV